MEVLGVGKRTGGGVDWLPELLWEELCADFPELGERQREGVNEMTTAGGWRVRWASKRGCGFLAVEAVQLDFYALWEVFAVRVEGGELRTGWRRQDGKTEAPEAW